MVERHRREWHDPTAEKAIRLADKGGHSIQRHRFAKNRLTEGAIRNADPLRKLHTLLEQIQKEGRIK